MKIRLTPELKETIEESAKKNGRSMNAEIVYRLAESYGNEHRAGNENPLKKIADHAAQIAALAEQLQEP